MGICKYLIALVLLSSAFVVFANAHNVQIYARGFNYVVIASPTHNVTFVAYRDSQRLLSPNILIENNVASEQIPFEYWYQGEKYKQSLLVSPNISSPYISLAVITREAMQQGERITVAIETNVPLRAIGDYTAMLNGRDIPVIDGQIIFDSYNQYSKLEVSAPLLSERKLLKTIVIKHEVDPQTGCDVVLDKPTLYAVCYSNLGNIDYAQFNLGGKNIGSKFGELVVGETIPTDLILEVMVDRVVRRFSVEDNENIIVSIPID